MREAKPFNPELFWGRVNKTTSCWEWVAALSQAGYGFFRKDGKCQYAHRISYELFHGQIPAGLHILHSCDNRKCVNPAHLSAGSARDNMQDKMAKGRAKADFRYAPEWRPARVELTQEQIEARFWGNVDKSDECWLWRGANNGKYGKIGSRYAHRMSYEMAKGAIAKGLFILHSCDNPLCVNPNHLSVGTPKQNTADMIAKKRDRNSRKTHCKRGHELAGNNLLINSHGNRGCRACRDERAVARHKATYHPRPSPIKTHCKKGHEWIGENIYTSKLGDRCCRICKQVAMQEYKQRQAA